MKLSFSPRLARYLTYGLGFLAFYLFLTFGYGEVLERAEQESYVSFSSETMYYVLSKPLGTLWLWGRYALLVFNNFLIGGAVLALIYTLTARLADYACGLPRRFEGLGFLVPLAQVGWILYEGTNLYYKTEPSRFMVLAIALMIAFGVLALITFCVKKLRKQTNAPVPTTVRPYGLFVTLLSVVVATFVARTYNENEWLTARLQNLEQRQDWETMIEEAGKAERPTRAVNAYRAIALLREDRLLDELFDVVYDFPTPRLNNQKDEYALFVADCNYHAGLLNASYRVAMEQLVMNGPNLRIFKRLAECALLNGEDALCRKYLKIIQANPFEGEYVERMEAFLNDKPTIEADRTFSQLRKLLPREDLFEQRYRTPAFLGYNIGLSTGSLETLKTSIAACLYAKDLQSFLVRAQILAAQGVAFPDCMQQAIVILAQKNPEVLTAFPRVAQYVAGTVRSFYAAAQPYLKDREALRRELKNDWLGTYLYYYYTENNNPDQVLKTQAVDEDKKTGVN